MPLPPGGRYYTEEQFTELQQNKVKNAIKALIGPVETQPEIVFQLEDLQKEMGFMKDEVSKFREVITTV